MYLHQTLYQGTCITDLDRSGFEAEHIMVVSNHKKKHQIMQQMSWAKEEIDTQTDKKGRHQLLLNWQNKIKLCLGTDERQDKNDP